MMTQKVLCLSVAVALLCGLATTSVVRADETDLNAAVGKIEAVGKMIAELKLAAAETDRAAEDARAVLIRATQAAVASTHGAAPYGYGYAYPAYSSAPYYASAAYPRYQAAYPYYPPTTPCYRVGLFGNVRPAAPYPYQPGYAPYPRPGCRWGSGW
ncbi:MAG: hypothetical protein LBI05_11655 [Planctomycetaceae bacterium]|jgi:hypothetical protein|nr:hypothetical protein [Planctomycetaceae bacterium]